MISINDIDYEVKFSNECGRDKLYYNKDGVENIIYDSRKIYKYIISEDKKYVYVESNNYYDGHMVLCDIFNVDKDDEFFEVAYGKVYGFNVKDVDIEYIQLLDVNSKGLKFENKFYSFCEVYDNDIYFDLGCITKNCNKAKSNKHHKYC